MLRCCCFFSRIEKRHCKLRDGELADNHHVGVDGPVVWLSVGDR